MRKLFKALAACTAAAVVGLFGAAESRAQYVATRIISSGLINPLYVTHAPGDFSKVFIVEQRTGNIGRIRIMTLPSNTLLTTPFLQISPVTTGSEQGLLGLALHPNYVNNGYFWVNYTNSSGTTIIARYQANGPDFRNAVTANPTGTTLLSIAQPFSNHNGGWIGFGPDGYLYIATGDGGSGGDPGNRAQNLNELLGKTLRIDVDGADNIPGNDDDDGVIGMTLAPYTNPADNPFVGPTAGRDEIWAWGLRNHWRNSFDRQTGQMYIGDVGQNNIEEISYQPAHTIGTLPGQTGYQGGRNYGWRCYEGAAAFNLAGCGPASNYIFPIHTYTHAIGFSITGGYVYRGCNVASLNGNYFFADFGTARIWTFQYSGAGTVPPASVIERTADLAPGGGVSVGSVASFGEDAYGELYIVDLGGEVFKLFRQGLPFEGPDCNANGKADCADILDGTSMDVNGNMIPDECEARACCLPDGMCADLTPVNCSAVNGVSSPLGTLCASVMCPQPTEACCFTDGSCQDLTAAACATAGGAAQGVGSVCASTECPVPCPGDLDGNGCVNLADISIVLLNWEMPYTIEDLAPILLNWELECVAGACSAP